MLLLFLAFSVTFTVLSKFIKQVNVTPKSTDYIFSFTLVLMSVFIYLFTEISSAFNILNSYSAHFFWITIVILGLFCLFIMRKHSLSRFSFSFVKSEMLIVLFVGIIVIVNFLLAIISPPNNFDSHNYHLTRIISWIQNENVNHYPTRFIQQLYHNVLGEYLVMQTYLLSATDKYANLIQFTAMIGTLCNINLIAKQFSFPSKTRVYSVFLMATLPIGLFESTTTQVDYIACFYFTFFIFHLKSIYSHRLNKRFSITICLISLLLGAFTKYTIFLYAFPFVSMYFLHSLFKRKYRELIEFSLFGVGILLLIFLPFWLRNFELFGNILAPSADSRLINERIPNELINLDGLLSNTVKNLGLNVGLPFAAFNQVIDKLIVFYHGVIGVDLNNPNFSMDKYFTRFSIQEDMAPNTLHFFFSILAMGYMVLTKRNPNAKKLLNYVLLAFVGLVISSTILKFQLWSTRTQMPFFAINAFLLAWYFEEIKPVFKWIMMTMIMIFSLTIVFTNPNKPIVNLKYQVKKALSYIPPVLISNRIEKSKILETSIRGWYQINEDEEFVLKNIQLSNKSKKEVFNLLDSVGYFNNENNSILQNSRELQYFVNDPSIYLETKALFDSELKEIENVGIYFVNGEGFYNYWAYLNYSKNVRTEMKYIRIEEEFKKLSNTIIDFSYNYILTDDEEILSNSKLKANIDKVFFSGHLTLIKLKKKQNDKYFL